MSAKPIGGLEQSRYRLRLALVLLAGIIALLWFLHNEQPGGFRFQAASSKQFSGNSGQLDEVSNDSSPHVESERDRAISAFLAKRYRVSQQVMQEFVRTAFVAGQGIGVDPLLIIAVMAVESGFNPIAESVAGAKGLMQIIPKFHAEKLEEFGGEKAIFEPRANILVGSQILREYIQRMGDVGLGLRIYGGGPIDGENRYPDRVLDEKRRLQQVVTQHDRALRPTPSHDKGSL
jgi:hypothetical protein